MVYAEYAWLIPIMPIIGLLLVALLGKKTPEGGGYFAVGGIAASCILGVMVAFEYLTGGSSEPISGTMTWLQLNSTLKLEMGYYIDSLSAVMLIVVTILCTLILVYSLGYMHQEGERKRRYYIEISLFVVGMEGLVVASNYLEMFIFWEIMGLCSYLLIGFWYYKPSAAAAAKKAFLVTRIGDILFMTGIITIFASLGTLNFRELFTMDFANPAIDMNLLGVGLFCVFGGAVGKSAQFPLHDWLPDAMEGPTTVSALIHAATMVKAGVYLVARSFPLMVQTPDVLLIVACIGGFTALFAATMALNNPNIKRVLAYSTISQLGYMFLALGAGGYMIAIAAFGDHHVEELGNAGYMAGMFHLINHAFFKALLFLSAGAVIHAVHTEDMRLMGGLSKKMKITSFVMLIGALSIAGIPPLSGFWSKDEVLAAVWNAGELNSIFMLLYVMGIVTAFLTAFYMFRLWFMTFKGEGKEASHHAHEAPKSMVVPLMILAIFAFSTGFILMGPDGGLPAVIRTVNIDGHLIPGETLGLGWIEKLFSEWQTWLSIIVAVSGVGLAYMAYCKKSISVDRFATGGSKKVYDLLLARYGFPKGYDWIGKKAVYGFSLAIDLFDRKVIDGVVNGISRLAVSGSGTLRKVQTGIVQTYATVIIAAVSVILILMYLLGGLR
jgi:NADH:ubiquinone oxidoreductase subunit 5 (subunit L)/multisubunit Na+/H+ antiporter MnhA subunit